MSNPPGLPEITSTTARNRSAVKKTAKPRPGKFPPARPARKPARPARKPARRSK